jgi:recombination protein RecA
MPAGLPEATPELTKRTDALIAAVRKIHGPDSIHRLNEYEAVVATFPSGLASLDAIIGVGGVPLEKFVHVTGAESVGKSSLVNYLAARAQHLGMVTYFLDGELSESRDRAQAIGVNTALLTISEPETLEAAFAMIETALEKLKSFHTPSLLILDSIAAFPMEAETDLSMTEDGRRGARAAFLAKGLRRIKPKLKGTQACLILVNQLRAKMNPMPFEKPTQPAGGWALRHASDLTIELTRRGTLKKGQEAIGIVSRGRVEKSKIAPPFKAALWNMYFAGKIEDADPAHGAQEE